MEKKFMILIGIIAIILIFIFVYHKFNYDNHGKFYLDSKYYSGDSFIKVDNSDVSIFSSESYVLFTYNHYCSLPIPCETIFEEFMKKYNISFLSIPIEDFKKTWIYQKVKYAPSIIIVRDGHIVDYLDANSDDDLDKYQDVNEFEKWISKYIYLKGDK